MWQEFHPFEQESFDRRLIALFVGFSIFLSAIAFNLFYLQIIRGERLRAISERNCTQVYLEKAPRGIIYDRKKNILVDNLPSFAVLFSPVKMEQETFQKMILRLSKIINQEEKNLSRVLEEAQKKQQIIYVAENISRSIVSKISEQRVNLPGISLVVESKRRYRKDNFACHLLGYLGEVDSKTLDEQKEEGYRLGDFVGKTGIELAYDKEIRGTDGGQEVEVDSAGRSLRFLRYVASVPGNNVELTIDAQLQEVAEKNLWATGKKGAVIALDPNNGEVLALASSPGFNPNIFLNPLDKETVKYLFDPSGFPLINRAIQGLYPLGSVFKIVTVACALEEDHISRDQTFFCPGYFILGGRKRFNCWKEEGHGTVNLTQAVTQSCDTYFYQMGLKCGAEDLSKYADAFGLGNRTGIELAGESVGLVPSPSWKKKKLGKSWYAGDTANYSIGQGFLTVTPIAAAELICLAANRGHYYRPYVVKRIVSPEGEVTHEGKKEELFQVELSPETWDTLDNCLTKVVAEGTGIACSIPGIAVRGKTGTAENPHGDTHAWFGAYAGLPGKDPEIACIVLVEAGGMGSSVAGPIAREMIKTYFRKENVN